MPSSSTTASAGGGCSSGAGSGGIRRNNSEFNKLPTTEELDEDGDDDEDDQLEGAFFMVAKASDGYDDENKMKNGKLKFKEESKLVIRSEVDATEEMDESSFTSGSSSDLQLPTPPDGGWGWVIVFASFMIHIIADGITYTFGIYVVELMDAFGEGRGSVSLIPSILTGVTLGVGPIASVLVNKYGCRAVTMAGSIIAAFGLAVSAATPNISMLYITIGLCTGLGFGLIYLPAIVSVTMYFEKKRAFATGIAVCGSGLGTFILAPVTRILIDQLGWKGAIMITGAIVLFCIAFGALMRPIPTEEQCSSGGSDYGCEQAETVEDGGGGGGEKRVGLLDEDESHSALREEQKKLLAELEYNGNIGNGGGGIPELRLNGGSLRPLAFQVCQNGDIGVGSSKFGGFSDTARMALSHPVLSLSNTNSQSKKSITGFGSQSRMYEKPKQQHGTVGAPRPRRSSHEGGGGGVLFRKDIFYHGSLYNIPEYKSNPRRYARQIAKGQQDDMTAALNIRAQSASKLTCSSPQPNEMPKTMSNRTLVQRDSFSRMGDSVLVKEQREVCGCCPASKTFSQMTDVSLLKNGIFMMFAVSNFLTSIGFGVPYIYTVDRAIQMGIGKDDASYLLSVIGIANTLGRIVLGWLSDKPWVNRLYTYNICLAICGLTMGLSNYCDDYASQAFYCAVFGVTSGAYVGLTSVVLVDLLGLDRLTNAFGLLLLFQGIASVLGPPIIGGLYDAMGNYDTGFYFAGAMIFISGIMLFALPWMQRGKKVCKNSKMAAAAVAAKCNEEERQKDNSEKENEGCSSQV